MTTSTFIQVSPYALLEYIYNTDEHLISEYTFIKLKNISRDINIFLNENKSATFSKNVLDFTFIPIDSRGTVGHCDQDQPIKLYELDENIDLTENLNIPSDYNVKYDTVKIHILAGYNLDGLSGIGCTISGIENSGLQTFLASHVYTLAEDMMLQNPKPVSIGERHYDKYMQFKVPSLSYINEQFYNLSTFENKQLGYYLTSDGKGFKNESMIYIDFYQFTDYQEENGILTMFSEKVSETSIFSIDKNSLISAVIQESDEGDYFEYFATYDGAFIEDYLAELNSLGNDYVIINELEVYENYGTLTRKKVYEMSFFQDDNFDTPNLYRPIISDNAYSFYIDYVLRLMNRNTNTQIIKTASILCDTTLARKYGKNLSLINVKEASAPIKIFNRITQSLYESPLTSITSTLPMSSTPVVEVLRFIDTYNVSVSISSSVANSQDILTNGVFEDSNLIFGNGSGLLYLSGFDNYVRFNFFKEVSSNVNEPLVLTNFLNNTGNSETIMLVFYNNVNAKKYVLPVPSTIIDNTIVFNISYMDAQQILKFTNKKFNIVYKNSKGTEMSLYEGMVVSSVQEYQDSKDKIKEDVLDVKTQNMIKTYESLQKKIDELLIKVNNT